jgi:hypothetical protein
MSISRKPLIATILLCCLATALPAVTTRSNAISNNALYGIQFPGDARSYYGKEDTVQSISKQEYITATFRVLEINIVTNGSALVRIYYSRPLKAGEVAEALGAGATAAGIPSIIRTPLPPSIQAMADRASGVPDAMTSSTVIKDYPIATHARTIEYRLRSRNELLDLFDELQKHWLKEPAFFESGQIVAEDGTTETEKKPRSLGGTLFIVQK